jgi:hypothetical protein
MGAEGGISGQDRTTREEGEGEGERLAGRSNNRCELRAGGVLKEAPPARFEAPLLLSWVWMGTDGAI